MPHDVASPARAHRPRVDLRPYDAILLTSFGGPEGPDEVMPFLRRVAAGRQIPEDRLVEVAGHYHARGGVSPINAQNRALITALHAELARRGADLPIRLGNRNSAPFLRDALVDLAGAGAREILVLLTSGYSSYSSCRQYREDLADALETADLPVDVTLRVDKVEPWFHLDGFIEASATGAAAAIPTDDPAGTVVLHVTHSLPVTMAHSSGPPDDGLVEGLYVAQHRWVADRVDARVAELTGCRVASELVYCSRSGPPTQPWLEPDVCDRIRDLAAAGVRTLVIVPIGFASDHLEVLNDLDTEAVGLARGLGLHATRVATAGTSPAFVAGLVDLMGERAAAARAGVLPAPHPSGLVPPADCPPDCCRNPRGPRAALCGAVGP